MFSCCRPFASSEQRMSSERASAGKITPGRALHPLALQDPRGRASAGETRGESPNAPWSERQLFLDGKAPDSEPGDREKEERSAERGPSSSFQRARRRRDPLRCRRRPRGVEGMQNKRKREERNWNVRCKGMDVPGELAAGLAVPTRRPVVSLSCALLERLLPKNGITWISCALSSCSSRSIDRLGYRRCATAKSVFYSADQKISLVPPRRDLGRLQS